MTAPVYLDVDPRTLRLPWSRRDGADPAKLARQINLYAAMIPTVRRELLNVLAELSAAMPDVRFGQLITNLSTLARGLSADGLWDAEDEELLAAAREQLAYFTEQTAKPE